MSHDLAALRQEVEELKAGMEQLKASQQQAARETAKDLGKADVAKADVTRASDQNLRPGISAPPPRPAAPPTRKSMHTFSPPHAAAAPPVLPQRPSARLITCPGNPSPNLKS